MTVKRVVHISSAHGPADPRIFGKECRSLAANGYNVTYVNSGGVEDQVDGVKRISARSYASRAQRMTRGAVAAVRAAMKCRADLYHLHDPELLPFAPLLKVWGAKVVFDAHEDLPLQVYTKPYIPVRLRWLVASSTRLLLRFLSMFCDGIVVATPAIERSFGTKDATLVQNYPRLDRYLAIDDSDYSRRDRSVVYVGAISEARGATKMIDAIGRIRAELNARLVLAGSIDQDLLASLKTRPGWDRVEYVGQIDQDAVPMLLARCRVGLVVLDPEPNYVESQPTKMFEYMAASLPVIASDFPLWKSFLRPPETGLQIDPSDLDAICVAIDALLVDDALAARMGASGRRRVTREFSWSSEEHRLLKLYARLLN